ncbi:olfactory receptor 1M1-like [Pyxicephalus adspersus]|uniref:olfactory receptor 1M1-like n=1 Tax=Pyxicephalus adspersus TaxID=30357 RepID=UPI003B5A7CC6
MESNKTMQEFYILPFFMKSNNPFLVFNIVFFFFTYLIGTLMNIIIITVICMDPHLHTPMYLLLCNLSIADICFTTVNVPKLLYILLSGNNTISFTQCFTQIYFFYLAGIVEDIIIFIMGYDRYVAICHPLNYHQIFIRKICIALTMGIWIFACVNSSLITCSISKMIFCSSFTIHQFFCDIKALINISCGGNEMFYMLMYANCLLLGLLPSMFNLMSYVKIIRIILRIKSKDGRSKAFFTCSSHLTVMVIYYGSAVLVYMMPPSDRYNVLEQILTVFYTTVVPMLNPLIYSLRNKELKNSLRK